MHWARTMAVAMITVALGLTGAGAARAQDTGKKKFSLPERPFHFRVGGFFPYDSDTRKALSTNFPEFGVGIDVYRAQWFLPVTYELYADYFKRTRKTSDLGRYEGEMLAVGLSAKYDLDPKAVNPQYRPYAGVGLGVYSARVEQNRPDLFSQSARRTTLGGKFFLGVEHKSSVFGEVGYVVAPSPSIFGNDVPFSGWQVRLGYRL